MSPINTVKLMNFQTYFHLKQELLFVLYQAQTIVDRMSLGAIPALPWFRDEHELPRRLPTIDEIEAASIEFPCIFDPSSRRVIQIDEVFVVKYGPAVFENEGHALLAIEKTQSIPAPRLYAMYRQDEKLYIIMEYIPGHRLSDIWPLLSETGKLSIANHLREIFDKLRALPSPGTFGGVLGGPLPHRYFFSYEKDPHITGPFNTEDDVYRALVFKLKKNWDMCARRAYVAELFDRHRQDMLSGHNSVFTHADFQRKNILVRERYDSSSSIDGSDSKRSFEVAAVLDWEFAGWYPSHWEYSRCFTYFDWSDDWLEKMERILNPCVPQAALMRLVGQDLDQF